MTSAEFLFRLKRYARDHDLELSYNPRRGKGSHGRVRLGDRITAIKSGHKPLGTGLLHKMLKDLGIDPREF